MNERREEVQRLALDAALPVQRCTEVISMRVGKTYIGLQYLDRLFKESGKILIVAPTTGIFQSWIDDAVKFGLDYLLSRVKFTTYLSLNKQDSDYDVVILDEVHSLKYGHSNFLDRHKGRILGLTGTEPRHPLSEKSQMLEKYCPVIFRYKTNQAVEEGILNNYQIFVHLMNLSSEKIAPTKKKDGGIFYQSETNKYKYYNDRFVEEQELRQGQFDRLKQLYEVPAETFTERVTKSQLIAEQKSTLSATRDREKAAAMFLGKALMGMPTKERYTLRLLRTIEDKCIVFANTKEQADRLSKHSHHSGNKNSKSNLELFKSGQIKVLSCINQLSEGITIPKLKECIILHSFGSEKMSPQRLARCLSLQPHELATIHILCFRNTRDEIWVDEALRELDDEKVTYIDANEYLQTKAA